MHEANIHGCKEFKKTNRQLTYMDARKRLTYMDVRLKNEKCVYVKACMLIDAC